MATRGHRSLYPVVVYSKISSSTSMQNMKSTGRSRIRIQGAESDPDSGGGVGFPRTAFWLVDRFLAV